MTDFRTLPVDEAVAWIRAWTDHTWPMSLEEAFTICDSLGWKPLPQDNLFFTTPLSMSEQWGGFISEPNEFGIKGVRFHLSSIYSSNKNPQVTLLSHSAHSQYVSALENIWGPGKAVTDDDDPEVHWKLPNGTSVSIIGLGGLISVTIDSPWRTRIAEEYDRVMEDYE